MDGAIPITDAQNRASLEQKAVINYLRSKNGPKARRGLLNGKRVDYFKGKSALKSLLAPAYAKAKKVPTIADEAAATALLEKLLPHAFFLRTDRQETPTAATPGQLKPLTMAKQQSFSPDGYYTWFIAPSALSTYIGSGIMVLILLAGVMFPLWPPSLRLGVYYLSLGLLGLIGLFIGIAIVRLILWVITSLVMKKGIWWFPNLFEDVGFVDSFIPFWGWDEPAPKKGKRVKTTTSSKTKQPKSKKSLLDAIPGQSNTSPSPSPAPSVTETPSPSGQSPVPATATATATARNDPAAQGGGNTAMQRRQQAYVEDINDDA